MERGPSTARQAVLITGIQSCDSKLSISGKMKLLLGSSSAEGSLVIMGDITCGWGIRDFGSSDAQSTCLIRKDLENTQTATMI